MKTILIFLLLAATASAQVIVDPAQGIVTGISNGGGSVSVNSSGAPLITPASGQSTTAQGDGFYFSAPIDLPANMSPVLSGAGHAKFNFDSSLVTLSRNGEAFLPIILSGTSSVPGVTITSSNGVLFLGGTATNSSYLLSTGTIAKSQVTNLVSDLAGKQAAGSYLTGITPGTNLTSSTSGGVVTLNSGTAAFGSAAYSAATAFQVVGSYAASGANTDLDSITRPTISLSATIGNLNLLASGTVSITGTNGITIKSGTGAQSSVSMPADGSISLSPGAAGTVTIHGVVLKQNSGLIFSENASQNRVGLTTSPTLGWYVQRGIPLFWSFAPASSPDVGMIGLSSGTLEVDNGTAGTYRDLKSRNITLTGTAIVGTPAAKVGGVIFASATNTTSVGTAETDLRSDVLAANTFGANNESVYADYSGAIAGLLTTTPTLRLYFGSTKVYDSGAITISADVSYSVAATLQRSGSNTVVCSTRLTTTGASNATYTMLTTATATLSATNVLRFSAQSGGTGTADGDITGASSAVRWYPAP